MISTKKLSFIVAGACLAFLLPSCGGSPEPEKKEEIKDTLVAVNSAQQAEEEDVSYVLPSPAQIAAMFKKSGLTYYPSITNNPDNLTKYKGGSLLNKAMNLGVYSADLSYCIFNKQTQQTKTYYKVCHDMAAEVGLSKAFEGNNNLQWMEKNISNTDSLTTMLVNVQMETDNILSEEGSEHVSVLLFTGAWIESMYLGIQVNAKEKNTNIAARLVEQMAIADNIIKALRVNKAKDPGIEEVMKQMTELNDIYNNFKSVKELKATDPDVIDPAKLNIGITELLSFSKKIEEIRSSIIKA